MPLARAILLLVGAVLSLTVALAACARPATVDATRLLPGSDPDRGRQLLRAYGCQACHTIPGVTGANGRVGPPLAGLADRSYIAGVVANTPASLMAWIGDPRSLSPRTAMPNLRVTPDDARDIAAFLYAAR